jgi:hypothetical protein
MVTKSKITIRVTKVDAKEEIARLKANIQQYERQYGTSSEEMLKLISEGKKDDTLEILRWMSDYHGLRLLEGAIPTNGKTSSVSKSSRKKG